jgi:hypothetical protein
VAPILFSGINQLDVVTSDPTANPPLTITTDASSIGHGLEPNQTSNQTYSLPSTTNGRGTIPVSGTSTEVFYMLSTSEYWVLFMGSTPTVEMFQQ